MTDATAQAVDDERNMFNVHSTGLTEVGRQARMRPDTQTASPTVATDNVPNPTAAAVKSEPQQQRARRCHSRARLWCAPS